MLSRCRSLTPLALAIVFIAMAASCEARTEVLLESRLPPAFPLPDGGSHVDSVALGTTITHVFAYRMTPTTLAHTLRTNLTRGGWHATGDAGPMVIRTPGSVITCRVEADGDGSRLMIEVVKGSAPTPVDGPLLTGPPVGYPKGFAFIGGGRLHTDHAERTDHVSKGGAIEIDYRDMSRARLAQALRQIAERARWMCTQDNARFLCTVGDRTVDVTLWRKGETVRLVVTEAP